MLSRFRGHLAHNVVAYLALFVALGGTAVAAKPLIDSAGVQDESLTGADVQNDTLTGDDVVESSLATVGDADRLDGRDSTDFLGAAAKAADSDAVDGRDSSQLGAPNTAVHGQTAHVNGVVDIGNEGGGTVAFVDVSAGKWLLTGKTQVHSNQLGEVFCSLRGGTTTTVGSIIETARDALSPDDRIDQLSLLHVATFTSPQRVRMHCDGAFDAQALGADLVALRIDG